MTIPYGTVSVPAAGVSPPTRAEWRNCLVLGLIVLLAFLLLQNSFWAAGPDTAYYITVSRNLALNKGFTFSGAPIGNIPMGWPKLLSSAMRISGSFRFLNLVPMTCLLGATMLWYWVLRRLVEPKRAFQATLLSAILYPWYSSSIQLRSEAFFCLIFTAALLVAFQVVENPAKTWRIILLLILCILMVNIRFAGLVGSAVVAAILLSHQRQWINRCTITAVLSVVVTAGAFAGTRYYIRHILPPLEAAAGQLHDKVGNTLDKEDIEAPTVALFDRAGVRYFARGAFAGQWVGAALWMPLQMGVSSIFLALAVNLLGWWLLYLFFVCAWKLAKSRNFILLGVAAYSAAIILRWAVVNPRYLVPVLPLILVGIWQGCEHLLATWRPGFHFWLLKFGTALFIVSLLLCNLGLFAVDAYIARSPHFYHLYNAGEVEQLLATAQRVRQLNPGPGEIAVNGQIINNNRQRPNGFAWRGLVMLTDRVVAVIPNQVQAGKTTIIKKRNPKKPAKTQPSTRKTTTQAVIHQNNGAARTVANLLGEGLPNAPKTIEYAHTNHIKYYAYKPPGGVWHAWHFNMAWLQKRMHKEPKADHPEWQFWEFEGEEKSEKLQLPTSPTELPTRVPGL